MPDDNSEPFQCIFMNEFLNPKREHSLFALDLHCLHRVWHRLFWFCWLRQKPKNNSQSRHIDDYILSFVSCLSAVCAVASFFFVILGALSIVVCAACTHRTLRRLAFIPDGSVWCDASTVRELCIRLCSTMYDGIGQWTFAGVESHVESLHRIFIESIDLQSGHCPLMASIEWWRIEEKNFPRMITRHDAHSRSPTNGNVYIVLPVTANGGLLGMNINWYRHISAAIREQKLVSNAKTTTVRNVAADEDEFVHADLLDIRWRYTKKNKAHTQCRADNIVPTVSKNEQNDFRQNALWIHSFVHLCEHLIPHIIICILRI